MNCSRLPLVGFLCAALWWLSPVSVTAQSRPYSENDIIALTEGGVATKAILAKTKTSCIDFEVTSAVADRLRSKGASDTLISGLRSSCHAGSNKIVKPALVPKPRVVVKRDTARVIRPFQVDSQPARPRIFYDIDFRSYEVDSRTYRSVAQDSTSECNNSRELGGYLISAKGQCYTPFAVWLPSVRIEAMFAATAVDPPAFWGITFGERPGVQDIFRFVVNWLGKGDVTRRRNGKGQTLLSFPQLSLDLRVGAPNRIAVEIRGRDLTFYVNGALVGKYTADEPVSGYAGFYVFGFGHTPTRVLYSSLRAVELR